jgi:hypothetical protein
VTATYTKREKQRDRGVQHVGGVCFYCTQRIKLFHLRIPVTITENGVKRIHLRHKGCVAPRPAE